MEEAWGAATKVGLNGAEFELSFKLTSAMVLYVGVPTMSGIVGNGKPSTILLMAVGMVID